MPRCNPVFRCAPKNAKTPTYRQVGKSRQRLPACGPASAGRTTYFESLRSTVSSEPHSGHTPLTIRGMALVHARSSATGAGALIAFIAQSKQQNSLFMMCSPCFRTKGSRNRHVRHLEQPARANHPDEKSTPLCSVRHLLLIRNFGRAPSCFPVDRVINRQICPFERPSGTSKARFILEMAVKACASSPRQRTEGS